MVPQMRNTHVLIRLIERTERTVGVIVIPTGKDQYTEAEIIGVGPGMVQAEGGVSETHDLAVGQVVYVKHKEQTGPAGPNGVSPLADRGVPYHDGERKLFIVGEGSVIAILAKSVDERDAQLAALAEKTRQDDEAVVDRFRQAVVIPKQRLVLPN